MRRSSSHEFSGLSRGGTFEVRNAEAGGTVPGGGPGAPVVQIEVVDAAGHPSIIRVNAGEAVVLAKAVIKVARNIVGPS